MPKHKGSRNLNGYEPWLKYGLTKGAYYNRKSKGLPLDKVLHRGRKRSAEDEVVEKMIKECQKIRKPVGRFSGLEYDNSPEKLDEIREKYKSGVTIEHIAEMVEKLT